MMHRLCPCSDCTSNAHAIHREDMAAQELAHTVPCEWCDYVGRHRA